MRLALQRLLGHDDALHCLRRTFIISTVFGKSPASHVCLKFELSLRNGRALSRCVSALSLRCSSLQSPVTTLKLIRRVWRGGTNEKASDIKEGLRCKTLNNRPQQSQAKYLRPVGCSGHERLLWHRLDADASAKDFSIWQELLHIRRRDHGVEGIRLVWQAVLEKRLELPTTGTSADVLWTHFLDLGFKDPKALKGILIYAWELKNARDRAWSKLYATVLGHHLRQNHDEVWDWHMRLYKHFPPSSQQFRQLLTLALHDEKLRETYEKMHASLPQIHIYNFAIPQLCRRGLYATAVKWHEKLIRRGDCPSDARKAEPVLRYLAMNGNRTRLDECTRLMVDNGVSFAAYRNKDVKVPSFILRDIVMPAPAQPDKTPEKKLSDGFCARLFATKVFSINAVIGSLVFLGAKEIGPQALREMAARELDQKPYHQAIQARLDQLKEDGISTGDSAFSVLVRQFAAERQDHLLRDVITCDLHSDTFEDHDLQESLLPRCQEQRDTTAFSRTLAILMVKVPEHLVDSKRLNYILRSNLTRRDLPGITSTIEQMQEQHIHTESKTIMHMRQTMLFSRQPGHRPQVTEDLDLLIRVWQSFLRSGSFLPPNAWTEILRRLGMSGQLEKFQSLALWLARWYSSSEFRESQMCMSDHKRPTAGVKHHHPLLGIDVEPSDPWHPLQKLFPRNLQQGILAWGFLHTCRNDHTHFTRDQEQQRELDWTWGLSLLRTLRSEHSVHIPTPVVAKAFKLRLRALFSPAGRLRRKISKGGERHDIRPSASFYIERANKIWGKDLLRKQDVPSLLQKRKTEVVKESRRVGGWTVKED
ncbi:MAG: hypothetical protein LQ338_002931 [Usnochroma carphineum]|nr:MAG: hypothetical protein LQ338_002931 [Usnochroma carphineum]